MPTQDIFENEESGFIVKDDNMNWVSSEMRNILDKVKANKQMLIHNYFLAGNEFPEWNLLKQIPIPLTDDKIYQSYIWKNIRSVKEELLRVDIIEAKSWSNVQTLMLRLLEDYQSTVLTAASERDISIGDSAFVGHDKAVRSLVFTRANMIVQTASVGAQDVSVRKIAEHIDNIFTSKSNVTEEGVLPKIETFTTEYMNVKVAQPVSLRVDAKDPLNRRLWHKFLVDRGELYLEDDVVFFRSNDSGESEITLYVVNENQYIDSRKLRIKVER